MEILTKSENLFLLSAVSAWEISIKFSLKKLQLSILPAQLISDATLKMNLNNLPITNQHALATSQLPLHHRDPFDRMLIAQAKCEEVPILTPDQHFKLYDVEVVW